MRNKLFGFLYAMNYIAQAAWSFVFPAGCIIGVGYLIHRYLYRRDWVMVAAIVVGVLGGIYSMFCYCIRMADYSTGEFNRHQNGASDDETQDR